MINKTKIYNEEYRIKIWQEIMSYCKKAEVIAEKKYKLNDSNYTIEEYKTKSKEYTDFLDNSDEQNENKIIEKYNINKKFIVNLIIEASENNWSKKYPIE